MPRSKRPDPPLNPDFLTFEEVAHRLGLSSDAVRDKALTKRQLLAVDVGNGGERATWRIPFEEYEKYRARLIAESQARFGDAA